MAHDHAIEAEGLVKEFGETLAVDDVSFAVPRGTVLGLLGPNGAGKTTTVRMMTTLTKPTRGTARVAGHDVLADPAAVRRSMGLTGQSATVDELLTGRENIWLIGSLYGLDKATVDRVGSELLERFSLTGAADRVVKTYSGGMRRRLDLAVSLVATPPVLFLDEPTTGLDPRARREVWRAVREVADRGTTVLLTTQYLDEADQLASAITVMDAGRVIASGTPDELKRAIGGDRIVATPADPADLTRAAVVLGEALGADPLEDADAGTATVPAPGGTASLADALRALDGAGIALADLELRRPTLDDAFLALTQKENS